jgi:hypothetical protein
MKLWHLYIRFLKLITRWAISLEDAVGALGALFAGAVITSPLLIMPIAAGMIFGVEVGPSQFVIPLGVGIVVFLFFMLPLLPAVFLIWQISTESMLRTLGITKLLGMNGEKVRDRLFHWSRKEV